jgi:hypothetical protein
VSRAETRPCADDNWLSYYAPDFVKPERAGSRSANRPSLDYPRDIGMSLPVSA